MAAIDDLENMSPITLGGQDYPQKIEVLRLTTVQVAREVMNSTVGVAAAAQSAATAAGNSQVAAASSSAAAASAAISAAGSAEAAASAVLAVAAGLAGTSTSSVTIGTGEKTIATQAGRSFAAGMFVTASASPAAWMHGSVVSYNSGTGALVVAVGFAAGSGTFSNWSISMSGPLPELGTAATRNVGTAVGNLVEVVTSLAVFAGNVSTLGPGRVYATEAATNTPSTGLWLIETVVHGLVRIQEATSATTQQKLWRSSTNGTTNYGQWRPIGGGTGGSEFEFQTITPTAAGQTFQLDLSLANYFVINLAYTANFQFINVPVGSGRGGVAALEIHDPSNRGWNLSVPAHPMATWAYEGYTSKFSLRPAGKNRVGVLFRGGGANNTVWLAGSGA